MAVASRRLYARPVFGVRGFSAQSRVDSVHVLWHVDVPLQRDVVCANAACGANSGYPGVVARRRKIHCAFRQSARGNSHHRYCRAVRVPLCLFESTAAKHRVRAPQNDAHQFRPNATTRDTRRSHSRGLAQRISRAAAIYQFRRRGAAYPRHVSQRVQFAARKFYRRRTRLRSGCFTFVIQTGGGTCRKRALE